MISTGVLSVLQTRFLAAYSCNSATRDLTKCLQNGKEETKICTRGGITNGLEVGRHLLESDFVGWARPGLLRLCGRKSEEIGVRAGKLGLLAKMMGGVPV
jgi:hypothetical protein